MNTCRLNVILAGTLLLATMPPALAVILEIHVTPESMATMEHPIQVMATRAGANENFVVTISAKSGHLSPFLYTQLTYSGQNGRSTAAVTQTRSADTATFRFHVPFKRLDGAVFGLTEQAYGLIDEGDGKAKIGPYLGGTLYNLRLRDFAAGPPLRGQMKPTGAARADQQE